jgi:hypothetical protein
MIHLLMSPKEKVVSSTGAFFIFFSKKLWVPNTSDGSRIHLDKLKVSQENGFIIH